MQCQSVERDPSSQLPQATKFINAEGKVAKYVFRNNPWKLVTNEYQKIFRYCVVCGENRFSDEQWTKIRSHIGGGSSTQICDKRSCWDELAYESGFVPEKHFLVVTEFDEARTSRAFKEECFEDVSDVTTMVRFDKVFRDESEMPKQYVVTFKQLEEFPIETRLWKIDSLYFKHAEEHQIQIGKMMDDTTDPFLKALVDYRQKSVAILQKLRN